MNQKSFHPPRRSVVYGINSQNITQVYKIISLGHRCLLYMTKARNPRDTLTYNYDKSVCVCVCVWVCLCVCVRALVASWHRSSFCLELYMIPGPVRS